MLMAMSRELAHTRDTTAEDLLSALVELAGDRPDELSLVDAARRVLRGSIAVLGAAGGTAHLVDADGGRFAIVESESLASVPVEAADLAARGAEAWLSTCDDGLAIASVGAGRGGLAIWFDEANAFPPGVRSFLRAIGRMLACEVDHASLLMHQRAAVRDREKLAHRARVLSDSVRLISSGASLQQILDELARVSCETPADLSGIRVLSADRRMLECRALYHRDPVLRAHLEEAMSHGAMPAHLGYNGQVLETGESLLLPVVDMDMLLRSYAGTPFGEYLAHFPISTVMIVPLRSRGTLLGAVVVARTTPDPFQPADLQFLEEVADRTTAAFDNAELLQSLTLSEERVRVALEAGHLGAWDWDIPAGNVSWSSTLEQIHGLEPGSFPGTFEAFKRYVHPEDRERVLDTIRRALAERSDYQVVYRITRPDGETRWLEAIGRLLCDATGAPQRLIGVCGDVTERKKSEEQLRDTLLALEDADHRKDQFLAMLAHELRNPLGPMLNTTHLLGIPGLAADKAQQARVILERQVRHMARLLDDLLDVSRITRGKIELSLEPVDMSVLIREVVADHLESVRAAGLKLEVDVDAELFVNADRTRLAQIIGNLLSNALKFSERGQSIRLHATRDATRERAVLTVRDEGAGIDPALLRRIFEPFVQADHSLSRPRGGLGLGLAVVKGLVDLHGGEVSAASGGPGCGAELTVKLPLYAAPVATAEPADAEPRSSEHESAMVLVFEDNEDAAESLRIVLSTTGYRVSVESTGLHAIDVVKRVHPDIVLCDIGLPDKDGYTIAQEIRADDELSRLPLIALSGYGSAEDLEVSRCAGFDLHLTKPVPLAVLLSALASRLGQ
jgi:PAS domain S-box-containing protein